MKRNAAPGALGRISLALSLSLVAAGTAYGAGDHYQGKFPLAEALKGLTGAGKLTATIETSLGTFSCELFEKDAPLTVANFVGLARGVRPFKDPKSGEWVKRPYYDGLIFHRVIPAFMIQGGDPVGNGTGDPGYEIPDEKNELHKFHKGGVLAMANKGPNTGGSQFFITEQQTPMLDDGVRPNAHYQIFGDCTPIDLVKKIAAVPRGPMDRPGPGSDRRRSAGCRPTRSTRPTMPTRGSSPTRSSARCAWPETPLGAGRSSTPGGSCPAAAGDRRPVGPPGRHHPPRGRAAGKRRRSRSHRRVGSRPAGSGSFPPLVSTRW